MDLLLAMSFLVVLHAFVHVGVPPPEHAIHQNGEFVGHGGNRFRCPEFAGRAATLCAATSFAPAMSTATTTCRQYHARERSPRNSSARSPTSAPLTTKRFKIQVA